MRPFRLIAGFLTLLLVLGGVLGDFFHVQERNETQTFAHQMEHTDTAGAVEIDDNSYALDSDASSEGCYETSTQVVVAPLGQQLSTVNAVGVLPALITEIYNCQREAARALSGRSAPLFEHASLFASTVSMRI